MNELKLKRCPFCASDEVKIDTIPGILATSSKIGKPIYLVRCCKCGARTQSHVEESYCVLDWNSRPIEDQISHHRNRLDEALRFVMNNNELPLHELAQRINQILSDV